MRKSLYVVLGAALSTILWLPVYFNKSTQLRVSVSQARMYKNLADRFEKRVYDNIQENSEFIQMVIDEGARAHKDSTKRFEKIMRNEREFWYEAGRADERFKTLTKSFPAQQ